MIRASDGPWERVRVEVVTKDRKAAIARRNRRKLGWTCTTMIDAETGALCGDEAVGVYAGRWACRKHGGSTNNG